MVSTALLTIGHLCHGTVDPTMNDASSHQIQRTTPQKVQSGAGRGLFSKFFSHANSQIQSQSMLDYETDKYDGVIIKSQSLPATKDAFHNLLRLSLDAWKEAGKHGIWLKIPSSKLEFAAAAADLGFQIHHGEKEYLMMTHWLSSDENKLPPNASHQVGVGCVVLNSEGKMLCVQEKNGPLKGLGVWKVPTGLADSEENLDDAARREVFEETGIETEFVGVMCFRQAHNFLFGKSDMFFVCLMKPTTLSQTIVKQDSEIAACDWVDLDTYCQQSVFLLSPLHARMNAHIKAYVNGEEKSKVLFGQHTLSQGFRPGSNGLFLPQINEMNIETINVCE